MAIAYEEFAAEASKGCLVLTGEGHPPLRVLGYFPETGYVVLQDDEGNWRDGWIDASDKNNVRVEVERS